MEQVSPGVRPHGADVRPANDGETCNQSDGTSKEAAAGASGQAAQMVEGERAGRKGSRYTQVAMGI